jgi:hypothetical protein
VIKAKVEQGMELAGLVHDRLGRQRPAVRGDWDPVRLEPAYRCHELPPVVNG